MWLGMSRSCNLAEPIHGKIATLILYSYELRQLLVAAGCGKAVYLGEAIVVIHVCVICCCLMYQCRIQSCLGLLAVYNLLRLIMHAAQEVREVEIEALLVVLLDVFHHKRVWVTLQMIDKMAHLLR